MKNLFILLVIALFIAGLSTSVYLIIFRIYLSKQIKNGIKNTKNRKKLIDPEKFFLIIFTVFFIFSVFCISPTVDHSISESGELVKCSDESFTELIDKENDVPGYKRYEKNCGRCRLIYYINENKEDRIFPSLLLYTESNSDYTLNYHINEERKQTGILSQGQNWYALADVSEIHSLNINISDRSENYSLAIEF